MNQMMHLHQGVAEAGAYEDGREYAMRIGFSGTGTVIRQVRSRFAQ
jgi:hypothetical protein